MTSFFLHRKNALNEKALREQALKIIVCVLSGAVLGVFVCLRVPIGRALELDGQAFSPKSPHFFDPELRARYVEEPLGHKRLYLTSGQEFWVSQVDFEKVWGESPKRTVRLRVYPVLAGFAVARVLEASDREERLRQEDVLRRRDAAERETRKTESAKVPPAP